MSKQSEALRAYFEAQGMKNVDIAEKLGVSPGCVSNMLAGRDKIGKNRARVLHDLFGFNYIFLVTGQGSLLDPDPAPGSVPVPDPEVPKGGGSRCPDPADLLKRIDELTAQLEAKREENEWLRSLVGRMVPDSK